MATTPKNGIKKFRNAITSILGIKLVFLVLDSGEIIVFLSSNLIFLDLS